MVKRKRYYRTLRDGSKLRAPRPMTKKEFSDWASSSEGRKQQKKAMEEKRIRSLPSFMTLETVFGQMIEEEELIARTRLDESRAKRGESNLSQCKDPETGISPAVANVLKGFERIHMFADTPAGKKKAKEKGDEYRKEGEYFVRVRRVYCKDTNPAGYRHTVWLKTRDKRELETGKERNPAGQGAHYGSASIGRGATGWFRYRNDAKAVECPKCDAPEGANCVTGIYPEGKRTNTHKARVFKWAEENDVDLQGVERGDKPIRLGARRAATEEE
jgi:hypothetical protein